MERFLQPLHSDSPQAGKSGGVSPVKSTAHPLPTDSAPPSEQSSVRRTEASRLSSTPVSPAQRNSRLAEKLRLARAMQRRLPVEDRKGQLLAVAILRQDEALLDELILCVSASRR
ncbi:MAG TPA: hypothetical protein VL137_14600 [Polyangiaceae bacterium]|nr:hypothetical protein [Polyangiaceae bacterium]